MSATEAEITQLFGQAKPLLEHMLGCKRTKTFGRIWGVEDIPPFSYLQRGQKLLCLTYTQPLLPYNLQNIELWSPPILPQRRLWRLGLPEEVREKNPLIQIRLSTNSDTPRSSGYYLAEGVAAKVNWNDEEASVAEIIIEDLWLLSTALRQLNLGVKAFTRTATTSQ